MNVYPALPGLGWPVSRTPKFTNKFQQTVSGRTVVSTYMQYPLYNFQLTYNYLSASDREQLKGFFLQQGGNLAGFWFDAGTGDDAVTAQAFGSGDGATTTFTLLRAVGGYTEPVAATFGTRKAYVAGSAASATFDSPNPGEVTFATAPASGSALTWTGNYYYQCRFKQSSQQLDEFMSKLYSGDVELETYR